MFSAEFTPWMLVLTIVISLVVIGIPLFFVVRYGMRRQREIDELYRKAEETEKYLLSQGVELGMKRYVYDEETDSFVREKE